MQIELQLRFNIVSAGMVGNANSVADQARLLFKSIAPRDVPASMRYSCLRFYFCVGDRSVTEEIASSAFIASNIEWSAPTKSILPPFARIPSACTESVSRSGGGKEKRKPADVICSARIDSASPSRVAIPRLIHDPITAHISPVPGGLRASDSCRQSSLYSPHLPPSYSLPISFLLFSSLIHLKTSSLSSSFSSYFLFPFTAFLLPLGHPADFVFPPFALSASWYLRFPRFCSHFLRVLLPFLPLYLQISLPATPSSPLSNIVHLSTTPGCSTTYTCNRPFPPRQPAKLPCMELLPQAGSIRIHNLRPFLPTFLYLHEPRQN